jgi:small subunit ribosomal protein S17
MSISESQKGSTLKKEGGKILRGIVVGVGMKDTVKVSVTRYLKHPKYKKFVKRVKKYLVHDPGNTSQVGDNVSIQETRPISKNKHFKVVDKSGS